jgi:hypothetical protein
MSTRTAKFSFNTAFSGVESGDGKWEKEKHDTMAKQVRGRIMSRLSGDGIDGMTIERYGMHVHYYSNIISLDAVIDSVQAAIEWAVDHVEGTFPLRKGKSPTATPDIHVPTLIGQTKITAKLKTNVYQLNAERDDTRKAIAEELAAIDGVRDLGVYIDAVTLTISDAVTTVETAKKHIRDLLDLRGGSSNYRNILPFAKDKTPLEIEWVIEPLMR